MFKLLVAIVVVAFAEGSAVNGNFFKENDQSSYEVTVLNLFSSAMSLDVTLDGVAVATHLPAGFSEKFTARNGQTVIVAVVSPAGGNVFCGSVIPSRDTTYAVSGSEFGIACSEARAADVRTTSNTAEPNSTQYGTTSLPGFTSIHTSSSPLPTSTSTQSSRSPRPTTTLSTTPIATTRATTSPALQKRNVTVINSFSRDLPDFWLNATLSNGDYQSIAMGYSRRFPTTEAKFLLMAILDDPTVPFITRDIPNHDVVYNVTNSRSCAACPIVLQCSGG